MHKSILLAAIGILFQISNLNAQKFRGGVTVGVAATQVDGDTYGGYNKAGPIVGIWVEHNLANSWFWRMNFRFIQKGSYARSNNPDVPDFYRMRLNYFELPVYGGYRFVNAFTGIFGLSIGYLSKASEYNALGPYPPDETAAFRKYELATIGGLEYNFSEKWRFGLIFSYSVIPIRPYRNNISYRMNTGQHNRVIEFLVTYRIQ